MELETLVWLAVAVAVAATGGGGASYFVTTWLMRHLPKDSHVDELISAVEKLNRQARQRRMREIRNGVADPDSLQMPEAPAANLKEALRARLRARRPK